MAFRMKISLSRAGSAIQIQRGVWEPRIEGQKEITKAWLSGVGSLKTVGHRRRCGVDTELLDKALVVENAKCRSVIG